MWYLLYNTVLILASPVILIMLLAKKRCRRGLAQRLGFLPPSFRHDVRPVLWVHAVSMGEAVAVAPLVRRLRALCPDDRIIVSTVTETGREAVEHHLAGVAEHCYAPLDFPWVVSRVVRALHPRAFLFVETEIWPNLLRTLHQQGIPSALVNGRFSSSSFRGYRLIKPFLSRILGTVSLCLMQSDRDVQRATALGARPDRVFRTGNLKFDRPLPNEPVEGGLSRTTLGLAEHEELIVAGSTHPVEEEDLLACYQALRSEFPALVLLLAPRHIERVAQVEAAVAAAGLKPIRRTALERNGTRGLCDSGRVIILDTRGELSGVYRHAVVSFVGGTLVPVGGHNLLEPALCGKPVFYGPYTDHCAENADLLAEGGGGIRVQNRAELAAEMVRLLRNRDSLRETGRAAYEVVNRNRGALERTVELLRTVLSKRGAAATLNAERGMMKALLRAPLLTLASLYGLVARARAALYQRGWLPQRKLPCRVVSVGNLTVGGTGKTPLVIALANMLRARGQRVAVLSRGYRRHSRAPQLLVSDGRTIFTGPGEAGDEPYLIAQRCRGVVVAVGADRFRLGQWLLEQFPVDCMLLDDGFQHLGLYRDVDLLLVDASVPGDLEALIPAGRLREPLAAAARASALVLTRADSASTLTAVLERLAPATSRTAGPILIRFRSEALVNLLTGGVEPIEALSGKRAVIFSGVANAASFRELLVAQGVRLLDELVFPDHYAYTARDLDCIRKHSESCGADVIVTTEKDAVKVAPLARSEDRFWALRLQADIMEGRERLERLILATDERLSDQCRTVAASH